MAEFRAFGATGEPDTCIWCGRKLRRQGSKDYVSDGQGSYKKDDKGNFIKVQAYRAEKLGDYEDGFFCGLRCGYEFGKAMAELGERLKAKGG